MGFIREGVHIVIKTTPNTNVTSNYLREGLKKQSEKIGRFVVMVHLPLKNHELKPLILVWQFPR